MSNKKHPHIPETHARYEEHLKRAIDNCELWVIYKALGVDSEGRYRRIYHSLARPFPGVAEAIPVWTSQQAAKEAFSRMQSSDRFVTEGLRVGTFGQPGNPEEKRRADMLSFLSDSMLPDCLLFNWSGRTEPDSSIARATRTAIRALILGAPAYWDAGPNAERLK